MVPALAPVLALATVLVFLVIFLVPVAIYGAVSAVTGLAPPGDRPFRFLAGVAISKLGTAIAFVGLWHLTGGAIAGGSDRGGLGHERGVERGRGAIWERARARPNGTWASRRRTRGRTTSC